MYSDNLHNYIYIAYLCSVVSTVGSVLIREVFFIQSPLTIGSTVAMSDTVQLIE